MQQRKEITCTNCNCNSVDSDYPNKKEEFMKIDRSFLKNLTLKNRTDRFSSRKVRTKKNSSEK